MISLASSVLGIHVLVFRSGSMSPTIDAGGVALTRSVPAADLHSGQIVSVLNAKGVRITHRILRIDHINGATELVLKGDANKQQDQQAYAVTKADRVFWHANHLGFVVRALGSRIALALGAFIAAGLLYLGFAGGRGSGGRGQRTPGGRRRGRPVPRKASGVARKMKAGTLTLVAVTASAALAAPAMASWGDAATATADVNTLSVPTTTLTCQGLSLASLKFTWNAVPDATSYTLFYNGGGNSTTTTATTATVGSLISIGSAWVVVNRNFGSTTWTSAKSNSVGYTAILIALCS